MNLLDGLHTTMLTERYQDWTPPEPPSLVGVKEIFLDFETTGVKWWSGDKPGGVAYFIPDGPSGYLPFGHKAGPNLDEAAVVRWLKDLRNVHIINHSTSFECHMARTLGVSFEEHGCTVSDIAHTAALLDDHRRQFSLAVLAKEFLSLKEQKVLAVDGVVLDPSKMMDYPSGMVAVRAIGDVRQVYLLRQILYPRLETEDLMRVQHLEDQTIYPVVEMEFNALPLDMELLAHWHHESEQRLLRLLWKLHRETGINFNPSSSKSWDELFKKLGIPWEHHTATGQVTTTDDLIKKIEHPTVKLARQAAKLADLKADFIDKYFHTGSKENGFLRFSLHQLRGDEGGTITGRFSASGVKVGKEKIGANPQQIPDGPKSIEKGYDPEFVIRKLFVHGQHNIPNTSVRFISSDMSQAEYRVAADMARNPRIMAAYEKDPTLSFHKLTHAMMLPFCPTLSYGALKNVNFAKLYSAGLAKIGLMVGILDAAQFARLRTEFPKGVPRTHPLLAEVLKIDAIYQREMPEVRMLLDEASHLAKSRCDEWCRAGDELHRKYPHQGYVTTLLGRRQRFPGGLRLHKALNGRVQGSVGDALKMQMVAVHRERKHIGFVPRLTNHDEICGDALYPDTAEKLTEILNTQPFPQMKIPLIWETKVGNNWAET